MARSFTDERTITPVTLIRHEPIRTSTGLAFVDWRDDSVPYGMSGGVRAVTSSVYARSDDAERFRRWRVDQRITASDVAKAAALGIVDAFGLERGECSPACGWDALRAIVLRWRDGKGPEP